MEFHECRPIVTASEAVMGNGYWLCHKCGTIMPDLASVVEHVVKNQVIIRD